MNRPAWKTDDVVRYSTIHGEVHEQLRILSSDSSVLKNITQGNRTRLQRTMLLNNVHEDKESVVNLQIVDVENT
jgi:hypothetical protein